MDSRIICWFSAGAPSAVAAKLALSQFPDKDIHVVYIDTGSEHPDNLRFVADCESWFQKKVEVLRSEKYRDTWDVWESTRFLVGPQGARCTAELKKRMRHIYQQPGDIQVFGYTADEIRRVNRFREQNFEVDLLTPLVERGLNRTDCLAIISRAGIELPAMYRLGYHNANCVGCVKGGMGYWNKIRQDFPSTFERMSKLEREIGHAILSDTSGPVYLDELDPGRGDYPSEPSSECGVLCAITEIEIG